MYGFCVSVFPVFSGQNSTKLTNLAAERVMSLRPISRLVDSKTKLISDLNYLRKDIVKLYFLSKNKSAIWQTSQQFLLTH